MITPTQDSLVRRSFVARLAALGTAIAGVVAVVGVPVNGGPDRAVVRFDDPTRPWHRYGFRVRAGRIFFTLGNRESDVWVADLERD